MGTRTNLEQYNSIKRALPSITNDDGETNTFSLDDITWEARYDAAFKVLNGSDVSELTDQTANGKDLLQTTASKQPLWISSDSNFNNLPSAQGDSVEWLQTAVYANSPLSSPNTAFMVFKQDATPASNKAIIDSLTVNERHLLQNFNTGAYRFFAGSGTLTGGTTDTSAHVMVLIFNGASSLVYKNGGAAIISGDPGPDDTTGLTIMSDKLGANGIAVRFAEFGIHDGLLTDVDINLVGNHLADKYGTTWTDI